MGACGCPPVYALLAHPSAPICGCAGACPGSSAHMSLPGPALSRRLAEPHSGRVGAGCSLGLRPGCQVRGGSTGLETFARNSGQQEGNSSPQSPLSRSALSTPSSFSPRRDLCARVCCEGTPPSSVWPQPALGLGAGGLRVPPENWTETQQTHYTTKPLQSGQVSGAARSSWLRCPEPCPLGYQFSVQKMRPCDGTSGPPPSQARRRGQGLKGPGTLDSWHPCWGCLQTEEPSLEGGRPQNPTARHKPVSWNFPFAGCRAFLCRLSGRVGGRCECCGELMPPLHLFPSHVPLLPSFANPPGACSAAWLCSWGQRGERGEGTCSRPRSELVAELLGSSWPTAWRPGRCFPPRIAHCPQCSTPAWSRGAGLWSRVLCPPL